MNKPALLAALIAPAVAAAQPAPPQQPLQAALTVKVGNDSRTHEVAVFDNACNRVEEKTDAYTDEIDLCTRPGPSAANVVVEVKWRTRTAATEYRTSSGAVMARKGSKFEVGRAGGARFTLQLL